MQEYTSPSERLKALTDQLEQGVSDIFQSGQYAAYLTAMSKFHHYSFGNTMLIFMQCPNATNVAGYHDWRRNFGRQVKRGERGITILAPCPYLCSMGAAHGLPHRYGIRCKPDGGKTAA